MKILISSVPALAAPCKDKPLKLQVDTGMVGAEAVLLQEGEDGVDLPVSFFSQKFKLYQMNYSIVEKGASALIWALQHFEVYVGAGGNPVLVYTDHNRLTFLHFLQNPQNPNQRLRWCLFFQPYNLEV